MNNNPNINILSHTGNFKLTIHLRWDGVILELNRCVGSGGEFPVQISRISLKGFLVGIFEYHKDSKDKYGFEIYKGEFEKSFIEFKIHDDRNPDEVFELEPKQLAELFGEMP